MSTLPSGNRRATLVSLPVILLFGLLGLLLVASLVLSAYPLTEAQLTDADGTPTWTSHRQDAAIELSAPGTEIAPAAQNTLLAVR